MWRFLVPAVRPFFWKYNSYHSLLVRLIQAKKACHISLDDSTSTHTLIVCSSFSLVLILQIEYCFKMMINVLEWEIFFSVLILLLAHIAVWYDISIIQRLVSISLKNFPLSPDVYWLTANDLLFCRKMTSSSSFIVDLLF